MTDCIVTLTIPSIDRRLKIIRALREALGITGLEAKAIYDRRAGVPFDVRLTDVQLGKLLAYNTSVPPVQHIAYTNLRVRPTPTWLDLAPRITLEDALKQQDTALVGVVHD